MASASAPYRNRSLLQRLGFRWVFPIGPFPVPFHPAIPLLFVLAPIVWLSLSVAEAIGAAEGGANWPKLLAAGALLGVPMSIPILAWAMMAFRAQLAQALFVLAAMTLLVVEALQGRTAMGWLVLPALFAFVWTGQRFGGMLWVRSLRRRADRFAPVDCGARLVVLAPRDGDLASRLIRGGFAKAVFVQAFDGPGGTLSSLVTAVQRDAVLALGEGQPPRGWSFEPLENVVVLRRPVTMTDADYIAIDRAAYRHPLLPEPPSLWRWQVFADRIKHEVVTGTAAIAGPLPLAVLLHWTAIFGGRSRWVVGFLSQPRAVTGVSGDDPAAVLVAHSLAPLEGAGDALVAEAHVAFAAEEQRKRDERARADRARRQANIAPAMQVRVGPDGIRAYPAQESDDSAGAFWRAVTADPAAWSHRGRAFEAILAEASNADPEDLRRALNWLEAAVERRARSATIAAAQYVAEMPLGLLAADYGRLERVFNSRIVGMAWHITPDFDVKPLPPRVPRFGSEAGYGLIRAVPELYLALAQLNPAMEEIVARLAAEAQRYGISLPPELAAMASPDPSATE